MKLTAILLVVLSMTATTCMAHGSARKREIARKEAVERKARQARAYALFQANLPYYNAEQQHRYKLTVERSRGVAIQPDFAKVLAMAGGPAALYTALNYYAPREPFEKFVQSGRENRWLLETTAGQGLLAPQLIRGLLQLKLEGRKEFHMTADDRAQAAMDSTLRHHAVFFEVDAKASYRALMVKEPPPSIQGRQIVTLTAVVRDSQGHVEGIGLYDSNVYNSKTSKKELLRYVSYAQLRGLLAAHPNSRFSSLVTTSTPSWDKYAAPQKQPAK